MDEPTQTDGEHEEPSAGHNAGDCSDGDREAGASDEKRNAQQGQDHPTREASKDEVWNVVAVTR